LLGRFQRIERKETAELEVGIREWEKLGES